MITPNSFTATEQSEPFADTLDENETLLWMDKPNRRAWMTNGYIFLAVAIAWGIMFIVPFLFGIMSGPGSIMADIALVVLFLSFYGSPCWLSIIYLWWLHRAEKKTVYACSDKRILIRRGGFGISCTTICYSDIRHITVRIGWFESNRGTGSLFLETGGWQPWFFGLDQWNPKRIVGIEKPYEVAKMINAQLQAAKKCST